MSNIINYFLPWLSYMLAYVLTIWGSWAIFCLFGSRPAPDLSVHVAGMIVSALLAVRFVKKHMQAQKI